MKTKEEKEDEKEKTKIQKNENNSKQFFKNRMEIDLKQILIGKDKRSSLIIKNISYHLSKKEVINSLNSLVKINYIFVPENDKNHKILGYAFINVLNYKDIINLIIKINTSPYYHLTNNKYKQISICYNKKQGVSSLIETFGKSDLDYHY